MVISYVSLMIICTAFLDMADISFVCTEEVQVGTVYRLTLTTV